jgi:hypothetical protein
MTMKLNNVELAYQDTGTNIAVCLIGLDTDIELQFNSFWNHGATNGELHWTMPWRAFFWTNEKRLIKSLIKGALYYILNNYPEKYIGKPCRLAHVASYLGKRRFREMPRESQIVYTNSTLEEYSLGTIQAEFSDNCDLRHQSQIKNRSFDIMKKTLDNVHPHKA